MKYPIIHVIARNEGDSFALLGTGCAISYNNSVIASEARQSPLLFYEIAALLSEARNDNFIPISRNMRRSVRCTQTT
jgi:hypothetical protein